MAAQYRLADFYLRERNKARQWSHVMLQTGRRLKNNRGMMGYQLTANNPLVNQKSITFFASEEIVEL